MTTTSPRPLRLYLIRHGETAWSVSGQHTGRTDLPLTMRGEVEAAGLASQLRGISFSHVLTSSLQRAQQTCALAGLDAAAVISENLVEWDYGDYEGMRSVDIRRLQANWNVFRDGCPNGETPEQVCQRADRFIARVRGLEGNVALFTHGHFGVVLAARWIGLPLLKAQHFMLGTATLSILTCNPHHPEVSVIELWNAASA